MKFIHIFTFIIFLISGYGNLYSADNLITMKTEEITAVKSWNTEIDQSLDLPLIEYNDYKISVESVTSDTTAYVGHIHSIELKLNSTESEIVSNIPFSIYFSKCVDDGCTTTKEFFNGTYTIPSLLPGLNTYKIKFIVPKISDQSGEYNILCALHNQNLKNMIDGSMTDDQISQIFSKASVSVNLDTSNITSPDVALWDMKFDSDQGPYVLIENTSDNQQLIKGSTAIVSLAKNLTTADETTICFSIESMDGNINEPIMVWNPVTTNFSYSIIYPELKEYTPVVLDTDLLIPNSVITLLKDYLLNKSEGVYDFKLNATLSIKNEKQIFAINNSFQCVHSIVKTSDDITRNISPVPTNYQLINQVYSRLLGNDTLNLDFGYKFDTSHNSDYTKLESKSQLYADIKFHRPIISNWSINFDNRIINVWGNTVTDVPNPLGGSVASAGVELAEQTVWSRSSTPPNITIPVFYFERQFGYQYSFVIYCVPVTLMVYAYGGVGGNIILIGDSKLRTSFKPVAEAGIEVGAFAGIVYNGFSGAIGLVGKIRLLRYELEAQQNFETYYNPYAPNADFDIILQTNLTHKILGPYGRLSLYGFIEIPWIRCSCKWYKGCCPRLTTKNVTLFDYMLYEYNLNWEHTWNIFSHTTTYTLNGDGSGISLKNDINEWQNLSTCDPRPCVANSCLTEQFGEQHCLQWCP